MKIVIHQNNTTVVVEQTGDERPVFVAQAVGVHEYSRVARAMRVLVELLEDACIDAVHNEQAE